MKMRFGYEVYFNTADAGGSAGGGASGDAGGVGAGAGGGEGDGKPQSLFAQLGAQFEDPKERESFEGWSSKYTSDKERLKAFNSMRTTFDQKVTLPGADGKPEDWHKLYTRLGKPETPKDYKFEWGDKKPDDAVLANFEGFKEFAHQHNLTQAQVEALVKYDLERGDQSETVLVEQVEAFQTKAVEALRKDWGADFDANVQYAKAAGQLLAENHDDYKAFADMTILGKEGGMRVGDHPVLLKMMAKVGRMFDEDTRSRVMGETGESETIQAKIRAIEEEAYKAGKSTSDREYHQRLEPLYKQLYPAKRKGNVY